MLLVVTILQEGLRLKNPYHLCIYILYVVNHQQKLRSYSTLSYSPFFPRKCVEQTLGNRGPVTTLNPANIRYS